MGRGDKKTKRGKITKGTYGNIRPHRTPAVASANTQTLPEAATTNDTAAKRTRKKKEEDNK